MEMVPVTKLESAEAQLITAIKLFFEEGSDIAIHTLTRASEEILDELCAKKNLPRGMMYEGLEKFIKPELHKKVIKKINEAKNYFKHAKNDTEETLAWNPKVTEYFIWDAASLHGRLVGIPKIPEIIAYILWFRLHHDDLWVESNGEIAGLDTILLKATVEFGHLSKKEFFEVSMLAWEKGGFRQ